MKKKHDRGIEITEQDGVPLISGYYHYWDAEFANILKDKLGEFIPFVDYKETNRNTKAYTTLFSWISPHGRELCGRSRSLEDGIKLPEEDVKRFISGIEQLHKMCEDESIPQATREFLRYLKVPDPAEMPKAWRVNNTGFLGLKRKLCVLWGYETKPGASILPYTDTSSKWTDVGERTNLALALNYVTSRCRINWKRLLCWLVLLLAATLLVTKINHYLPNLIHKSEKCSCASSTEKKCSCQSKDCKKNDSSCNCNNINKNLLDAGDIKKEDKNVNGEQNSGQDGGQNGGQRGGSNGGQDGGQSGGQNEGTNASPNRGRNGVQNGSQNDGQSGGQNGGNNVGTNASQNGGRNVGQNGGTNVGTNASQKEKQDGRQNGGRNGAQNDGQNGEQKGDQKGGPNGGQNGGPNGRQGAPTGTQNGGQNESRNGGQIGVQDGRQDGSRNGDRKGAQNEGRNGAQNGSQNGDQKGGPNGRQIGVPTGTQNGGQNRGQNRGSNAGQNGGQNGGSNAGQNGGQNGGSNAGQNGGSNAGQNGGQNTNNGQIDNNGQRRAVPQLVPKLTIGEIKNKWGKPVVLPKEEVNFRIEFANTTTNTENADVSFSLKTESKITQRMNNELKNATVLWKLDNSMPKQLRYGDDYTPEFSLKKGKHSVSAEIQINGETQTTKKADFTIE